MALTNDQRRDMGVATGLLIDIAYAGALKEMSKIEAELKVAATEKSKNELLNLLSFAIDCGVAYIPFGAALEKMAGSLLDICIAKSVDPVLSELAIDTLLSASTAGYLKTGVGFVGKKVLEKVVVADSDDLQKLNYVEILEAEYESFCKKMVMMLSTRHTDKTLLPDAKLSEMLVAWAKFEKTEMADRLRTNLKAFSKYVTKFGDNRPIGTSTIDKKRLVLRPVSGLSDSNRTVVLPFIEHVAVTTVLKKGPVESYRGYSLIPQSFIWMDYLRAKAVRCVKYIDKPINDLEIRMLKGYNLWKGNLMGTLVLQSASEGGERFEGMDRNVNVVLGSSLLPIYDSSAMFVD